MMSLDCERVDALLQAYLENEVEPELAEGIRHHLERCPECRDTLHWFREIERALRERRRELPSSEFLVRSVVKRLGLGGGRTIFGGLWGLPGIASACLIVVGVALYVFRAGMSNALSRSIRLSGEALSGLAARFAADMGHVIGGEEWLLLSLYYGVAALSVLTAVLMVIRFARD